MSISLFDFPREISVAISNVCCAKCIWCPMGQGLTHPRINKFIPLQIVDKLISDSNKNDIDAVILGDNGEALLHPEFKEITRRMRTGFPKSRLVLISNFYMMDEDMSRFVVDNFEQVGVNIDGMTPETYEAVKGMSFQRVYDNVMKFLEIRKASGKRVQLNLQVLSQPRYFIEIGEPGRITVPDDTLNVLRFARSVLRSPDVINSPFALTWAERKRWNRPRPPVPCTGMSTFGHKMFVDTDGNVYPCCLDYDSEIVFGNILDNTISEIWGGPKRKKFLDMIMQLKFAEIGSPCSICQD